MAYKLDPVGALTVLYSFGAGDAGYNPSEGVVRDAAGNLYGAADGGGSLACGTLYEIDTAGVFSLLHTFTCGIDGAGGGVSLSPSSTLYGNSGAGALTGGILYKFTQP